MKIRLFTGELNYICGVFHLFSSFGTYRAVFNEFVLATINLMFKAYGILISKCMWLIINYHFLFVS